MDRRGPDREAHYFRGSIGLGHCMLATTPESLAEEEPLVDDARNLCLTFDGRIDNRAELRSFLQAHDARLRGDNDAELVLAAYRHWGEDCPTHLLGDFAFAIWDQQRKLLFCARDPLGVRPFFYATIGDTFICASEIRSLFALPGLKKEPDLATVVCHLLKKYVEFDETIYRGVYRLPLAHRLTVTRDAIRCIRYWDIDPTRTIRYRDDDEYAEHFRELFFDSVRCRLRSRGPVAGMLSGGLDSSSIACTTQRIRNDLGVTAPGFETFSMVYDRFSRCDERPFINEVIRQCGTKANLYPCDQDPSEVALARRVLYPDVPYSPQTVLIASMFGQIKARNFHVLLDGNGGDELAGGQLGHLVEMLWRGKWGSLAAFLDDYSRTWGLSRWRLFVLSCIKPSIPEPVKAFKRMITSQKPDASLVRAGAIELTGARGRLTRASLTPDFSSSRQREMYALMFRGWGPTVATESYELLASYFGIEIRQPFRDKRLVEFAYALPADQLWRDAWSRIAFRNAMKGILPDKVRQRRGKGMFLPLYDSVLAGSQAKEVAALFDDSVLVRLGLADAEVLRNMIKKYQAAPEVFSTQSVSLLVSLELQCRDMLGESFGAAESSGPSRSEPPSHAANS